MNVYINRQKLNNYLIQFITIMLLILVLIVFILPTGLSSATEIDDNYLFQNQWYSGEAFLNFSATNELIISQKIINEKDYYKNNPIIIAVIDTGVDFLGNDGNNDEHPVFNNLIYKNIDEINGDEGIDDDNNGFVDDFNGWNFVDKNNNVIDNCTASTRNSHGTHVAGIVAQQLIAYGLTDYFKILPIKAGDVKASFTADNTIKAIDYAIACGAKIINMSLGAYGSKNLGIATGWGKGSSVEKAINRAYENDVIVVAAAGNDNKEAKNSKDTFYPAAFDSVYGVMAYDKDNSLATFSNGGSNKGDCYNFIAPGKNIYSTIRNGNYEMKNGTSMASPMVSAMIGVLMLKYDCNVSAVREVLDNYDTQTIDKYRKASLIDMLRYIPIEQIEIESLSENLNQALNDLSEIRFKANVYTRYSSQSEVVKEGDNSEIYDSVKWIIEKDDIVIATKMGRYFNYMPADVGTYVVTASTDYSSMKSNKIMFDINYAPIDKVIVTPIGVSGNVYTGRKYVYEIKGYEYVNPAEVPLFYWYINDVLMTSTQSYKLTFHPTEIGVYDIICKVADTNQTIARFNVQVKKGEANHYIIILQIIVTSIAVAVYGIIMWLIIKEIKIKSKRNKK